MTMDGITTPVALAAAVSPAWLPALQNYSVIFAALLPIVGVIWLAVQIAVKIIEARRGRFHEDAE
jgi:hypothetical protein